ncbi:4-(cytidine 5'-diphospho)-2-C-methyl-D-erythritol kinase [Mobiluncus mulieris]|nr:4-(cytidine 5'-diphospho)-2-C-methyl-D-erythritol kinase [Mobiluncus mulieris]NMW63586.1 4-(cytidine 5'-diphospho)-2-C-methyl-D-erythritol kinase [Mobiluncus mulieris]NMW91773.1 4-(cytidine 5'-diphospho)-2-C-methyl-D-erythritol kinase [Mobiluncus mulieris]
MSQHLMKSKQNNCTDKVRGARIVAQEPDSVSVFSPGKVNLYLRVGSVLADSDAPRHQLLTVFQCLSLGETLTIQPLGISDTQSGGNTIQDEGIDAVKTRLESGLGSEEHLDGPGNLVYKTLRLLRETSGVDFPPTQVLVDKKIPIAGGLAGGSADAAGTIVGVNRLYQLGLSQERQLEVAARLGADVPALLLGGNSVGTRFGDILEPLPNGTKRFWILAIASAGLSTPQVFGELDRQRALSGAKLPVLPDSLPKEFLMKFEAPARVFATELYNELEAAALRLRPELQAVKTAAVQAGALAAIISGSGPTVACLCADALAAAQVYAELQDNPLVKTVIKTTGPDY